MKIITKTFEQYVKAIFIFIILGFLWKIIETIYFIKFVDEISSLNILKGVFSLIVAYCFYCLLLSPIYLLLCYINKTVAQLFFSVVLSLIVLLEAGLTIYYFITGALLGAELFVRPFSEVIATIEAILNIWIPVFVIILTITLFYSILFFLNRKKIKGKIVISIAISAIVLASFAVLTPRFANSHKNPMTKNYIVNKSFYCLNSTIEYWQSKRNFTDVIYDSERVTEFLKDYPDRKIINKYYPLEREYDNNNVLAPYFKPDTIKPNIVIFVLEAVGNEWTHSNVSRISFTPFLDSLANTGLYWKNCISTTKRSFGIVPSITGSLPFGVKGFQFGYMPDHNSLIKILKENNYQTNAFYAGAFYFDAINDYLLAQDIDYMSENYYINYKENETEYNGYPYWGYQDSIMYTKILQDQKFSNGSEPFFNLHITISAHHPPDKRNPYFSRAYKLVKKIIDSAPKEKQEYFNKKIDHAVSIFYQDLCLRDFFENYRKRKDFENTIFIFTGDHASGMMPKNDLSLFHVPLIIWSPLLLETKRFPALVSHNDFVPTIEALLKENYNLTSAPTVHWLGNSLDTSSVFVSKLKTVMFDYSNGYKDIVYNNYYYNDQLFEIQNENLDLVEIKNDSIIEFMKNRLDLYKYIQKYVYLNNKLTKNPLTFTTNYQIIQDIIIDTATILFESTSEWKEIYLYPENIIEGEWEKIKLSITGEIMFLTIPADEQYYELMIVCDGNNMQNANYYTDVINKFIMIENIELNKWYPLHIEKQFMVEGVSDIKVNIYFVIGGGKPQNYSKLNKTRILIEGEKRK
ncbi:MAG: sulfatase-like hydrolase/transferase [Bacteroidales bacterium]|jgi:uncharacterized sulfatase|nr:sulfatase-like hydrolase/transferase [Bacteroidales bacterium]